MTQATDLQPALRFAPSPNGYLHLGHALSALITFRRARAARGRFLLRIEDIDTARVRPAFIDATFADLRWLGLDWKEPVMLQSRRMPSYAAAVRRLEELGLTYPCFATRAEIEAAAPTGVLDPDGAPLYPGLYRGHDAADVARRKASGEAFAMRLNVERAMAAAAVKLAGSPLTFTELGAGGGAQAIEARPQRWGDVVIARKDVPTSYHLAVVVDDAWQGVTEVTRGRDLFPSTDVHRLLQVLLDLPEPVYFHHRLITDAVGRKLSKSARDTSLRSLRANGCSPADISRMVGLD